MILRSRPQPAARIRFLVVLILATVGSLAVADASMFETGKHCVAYKVKKKSLSLFSSWVIGKNCDISVQLLPVVGGGYQVEVSVPINGFDSGDKDRDEDVKKILKETEQPDILFRSKTMTDKEWRQALKKPNMALEGELNIGGKSYNITAPSVLKKNAEGGVEVDGVAIVPFNKFELQPPKVGGGLIVKADTDMELHFHLVSDKILGADKVLGNGEKEGELVSDADVEISSKEKEKEKPKVKEALKPKESKELKEVKDSKDTKELKEAKEIKEAKEPKESKESE